MRLLALAECGTRALIAACCGGYRTGEKTLARQLLTGLQAGMLLLADANFACYELWRDAAAGGAELLWRAGAQLSLPVDAVLGDGTYLSRLKAPRQLRRQGAAGIVVRVIEYRLEDAAGQVTGTFVLIATLLDPGAAPARELAELYHSRWEIETALGAFKTGMKGAGIVLRSKTPDGAEQEIWALLCAYHHPRADLRRRCPRPPGSAADLLRQRPGHRPPAGRQPGRLSPLTTSSAHRCWSSPPSPASPGPAGTTPATPSAATATPQRPPILRSARSPAGRSRWSCCLAGTRTILKLKVLGSGPECGLRWTGPRH